MGVRGDLVVGDRRVNQPHVLRSRLRFANQSFVVVDGILATD